MSSIEFNIEAIVILCLTVSPILAGDLRHQSEDTDTVSVPSRIVVKCEKPEIFIPGKSPDSKPMMMMATVTVTPIGAVNQAFASFDAWAAAVQTLLTGPSLPAPAITLATSVFPQGMKLDYPSGGYRSDGQTDERTSSVTVRVIFPPL